MQMQRPLKIGTRGSPLALYQARLVQSLLAEKAGIVDTEKDGHFPIVTFTTSGDKLKGELAEFGGKGLFTKELEVALLDGEVDIAVHSMKDVPTKQQTGLIIGAVLEREDPRDAFISQKYGSISDLPFAAVVGTASLRRRAQLSRMRPDIQLTLLRGNVGTRLRKLAEGECDATFLAYAGLKRLNRADAATDIVDLDDMLCAPAQGAIGIELRADDADVKSAVKALNHFETELCVTAERAFLAALDGSCRTPIAALAQIRDGEMSFRGEVYSLRGDEVFSDGWTREVSDIMQAITRGQISGETILAAIGGRDIWSE